ncbi:MAG: MFS transporter [Candidatus Dormibacteraeota bacterium]|nr:MFS transporter [Candidatus Dormibacteraeota bacterium]
MVLCGTFVFVLDFFVVNVALPSIQRTLGAGPDAVEWIVAGYGLATASLLVCGGRLGDRYGRRRWFSIGLSVFILASALCALAPSAAVLVGARVVQGLGAALMAPNVLAIVGVTYTGADRVRAITAYGIVMGVAAVGGQVIGGLLLQADLFGLGWRSVFWVNVPVGVAALLLAPRFVTESRSAERGLVDLVGAALLMLAVVAVVLPLVDGRQAGWPVWSWACLAGSLPLFALFTLYLLRTARRGRRPLLDPALFAIRTFRAGLLVQLCFWCQQAAGYLVIALFLQEGRGLSPLGAGGMFAVLAAGYVATSLRAPALTQRFGRDLVGVGAVVGTVGNVLLVLAAGVGGLDVPLVALAPGLLLLGAGQGLCITPLTSIVLSGAGAESAGSMSGALSTTQQIGNAVGVGVIGVVFFGLLSRGAAPAFAWSAVAMAGLLLAVAALSRLLPPVEARR